MVGVIVRMTCCVRVYGCCMVYLFILSVLYVFFTSRRRHTRCALVTGVRRVLFRSRRRSAAERRAARTSVHNLGTGLSVRGEECQFPECKSAAADRQSVV